MLSQNTSAAIDVFRSMWDMVFVCVFRGDVYLGTFCGDVLCVSVLFVVTSVLVSLVLFVRNYSCTGCMAQRLHNFVALICASASESISTWVRSISLNGMWMDVHRYLWAGRVVDHSRRLLWNEILALFECKMSCCTCGPLDHHSHECRGPNNALTI